MAVIWIDSRRFAVPPPPVSDADAEAYLTAVQAADGQFLEVAVRDAINAFVLGCKADGIWNAIKASCIMAGARTLNGCLVPLVGTAPTNVEFVSGDYDRKTGLVGNGTSKYLNSNRNNNADPQNSKHVAIHVSSLPTVSLRPMLALDRPNTEGSGASLIYNTLTRLHDTASSSYTASAGFIGINRSAADSYVRRNGGINESLSQASVGAVARNIVLFADNLQNAPGYSDARLAFYSIGESLDLALLDARVTALMSAISTSIASDEAAAYIARVEAADGQPLEQGVRDAITTFIIGCAQDGNWNAIKASCILAGARTLNGCLVPLVGTAPTNFNFVAGDYNRKTGLVGDGSTKYLDSNRAGNADPQNNQHASVYLTVKDTVAGAYIGARNAANPAGSTQLVSRTGGIDADFTFVSQGGTILRTDSTDRLGLLGLSRSTSASFVNRLNKSSTTATAGSENLATLNYFVFNRSGTNLFSNARLSFYSIGESLDLALLDARVTALMSALAVAIP